MSGFTRRGSRQRRRTAGPMVRSRRCAQILGASVAGALVLLAAAPDANATCRGRNFVDRMSVFVSGTVRATSSDGETYDNIRAGSFDADFSITLCGDGALDGVIVHLGECTGHQRGGCTSNPIMYQEFPSARSLSKKTPTFTFAPAPGSAAGKSILQTCNAHADEQRGAAQDKEIFPGFFSVTLGVDTRYDPGALGLPDQTTSGTGPVGLADQRPLSEYSKTEPGTLTLKILCAPLPAPIKAPPKITGAQLGVAAFGDTCPKPVAATVMIDADAPRPVFYKIERGNGTTTTDDWIEGKIELQQGPDGRQRPFLAAQHKLPPLDRGARKFRLWVDTWGKTPWRTVEVDCLVARSGKLTLKSLGAASCRAEALVAIRTSGAGKLPYELECGPGRSWQRSVTAPDNKIGVDKVQFDVKDEELVTCALRTRLGGKLKSLDGASRKFQCHRPGSSDFVPKTTSDNPPPVGPPPPRIVADPSKDVARTCPPNRVGTWPNCRPRPCPKGAVGTYPDCRRPVRVDPPRCPSGMIGRPPNCRCPPGQVRLRGRCIRPAR